MAGALREAEALGLDCMQVFTKNQQQWKAPALKAEAVSEWAGELGRLGWTGGVGGVASAGGAVGAGGAGGCRTVSHASYLANMGSPDEALREKSIGLMLEEVRRCTTLGIPLLVFHPGAFTTSTREEGLARIAAGAARLLTETPESSVVLCFENVAGAGTTIGRSFEELAELRERTLALAGKGRAKRADGRVGFCIDTCHAHAAGYDLSTRAKADAALKELERVVGLERVRVLHLNDSKGAAGSRLDRHEHIGRGTIGLEGFAAVMRHAGLADRPMIMETPKGEGPGGEAWDTINARTLRGLMEPAGMGAKGARGARGGSRSGRGGTGAKAGPRGRKAR
jgi:deoxyribonuclease-4